MASEAQFSDLARLTCAKPSTISRILRRRERILRMAAARRG
jgi:hypothetical protein